MTMQAQFRWPDAGRPHFDDDILGLLDAIRSGDTSAVAPLRDLLMERGFDHSGGTIPEGRLWAAIGSCEAFVGGKHTSALLWPVYLWLNGFWFDMHEMTPWISRFVEASNEALTERVFTINDHYKVRGFLYAGRDRMDAHRPRKPSTTVDPDLARIESRFASTEPRP